MIEVRLTFTDQEVAQYFEQCGYRTGVITLGRWRRVSHGEDRWVEYDALVVFMPDGSHIEAREFLQKVASWRFKTMILTDHTAVDQYIETNTNPKRVPDGLQPPKPISQDS